MPEEVDCLTILGMGGRTICGILERGKKNLANVKDLIVSPQSCVEETIDFLSENGYQNIARKYIRETRYYPVLLFHKMGDYPILLDEGERCYGAWPLAQKDPLLLDMLRQRLSLLNTLPPTKKNLCEKMDLERRIASWN